MIYNPTTPSWSTAGSARTSSASRPVPRSRSTHGPATPSRSRRSPPTPPPRTPRTRRASAYIAEFLPTAVADPDVPSPPPAHHRPRAPLPAASSPRIRRPLHRPIGPLAWKAAQDEAVASTHDRCQAWIPRGSGVLRRSRPLAQEPFPPGFTPFPDAAVSRSIIDRFVAVATARANHTAVSSPAARWSYRDLGHRPVDRQGPSIARGSRRRPGARRRAGHRARHQLVAAILAVLAADRILVVLDPMAPAEQGPAHARRERLGPRAPRCRPRGGRGCWPPAAPGRPGTLDLDLADAAEPLADLSSSSPDDPVMLAFTSGTTGSPRPP